MRLIGMNIHGNNVQYVKSRMMTFNSMNSTANVVTTTILTIEYLIKKEIL